MLLSGAAMMWATAVLDSKICYLAQLHIIRIQ